MSKRSLEEDTVTMEGKNAEKKARGVIPCTIADVLGDLKGLTIPGAPSVGGKAVVPALPGLTVNGIGMLSLPLVSDETVKQLAAVATKSPFGKGSDTLVDESVRKSWQIEPAQVSFGNPAFHEAIQTLAKTAAKGLGVPEKVSVEAILYKVLLYESGGFFKKHRDTEKEDGMFATLVVQLPSVYTGGNLKVSHGEDMSKTYAMGTDDGTAPYCCHFVAHYADCEHEVEAVQSGYRLALVYSLCHKGKDTGLEVPTMEMATGPAKKLISTLERLPAPKQFMFFPLSHCYTTVSLARYGLQALKGRDSAVLRSFQLDGTWKFRIFRLARSYREDAEDFLDNFDNSKEEHRRIHTSEFPLGFALFEEVYWTEGTDDRLSDNWLSDENLYISCDDGGRVLASSDDIACTWKCANQIEAGYSGNEGYTKRETKYQCYTLMVYRPDAELDLVMEYDISRAIERVSEDAGKKPTDVDRLFNVLRALPQHKLEGYNKEDKCDEAEKALALLGEPTDGEFLEEKWVKNITACVNLIVFKNVHKIGMFWMKLGRIFARCAKAKNAQVLVTHFQSLLEKPVEHMGEATAKAYMVALVSVKAPNTSIDTMVQTLEGAIDPEKIDVRCNYYWEPNVLKSMMEMDITPSIHPLLRKLFPLWKIKMGKKYAYRLIPVLRCKMDSNTTKQWVDEIVPAAVDDRFLNYYANDLKKDPTLVHLVFEGGTDEHVEKLSTIVNESDEKAVHVRWLLPMLWNDYDGPTQSQAWKPLMERLVDVAIKETVERLLEPKEFLPYYSANLDQHLDLVHFLFANGTDEEIIKLLEIVDSKAEKADEIQKGLLKLYEAYDGTIKGKHAWDVLIQRLKKLA